MTSLLACCLALTLSAVAPSAFAQTAANPALPALPALPAPAPASSAPLAAPPSVSLGPQSREDSGPGEKRWYGWQTLASDAASIGLFAAALEADSHLEGLPSVALLTLSGAGYVAGAPTLHLLHHRPLYALGSLGLRLALPVVGGLVGAGTATCPPPTGDYGNCGMSELVIGAGVGILAATLLDASLSWESPKREVPAGAQWGFAPVLSTDGKHGELRVFGTF